jgi:cation transport ATPase
MTNFDALGRASFEWAGIPFLPWLRAGSERMPRSRFPATTERFWRMAETQGRIEFILIPLVGLAIAFHEWGIWQPVPGFDLFGFLVTGIAFGPIFLKAFDDLLVGRLGMEVPLLVGLAMALGTKQVLTALWIVCFVLTGRVLERFIVSRRCGVSEEMRAWLPHTAGLRSPAGVRIVEVSAVRAGDIVLVNPGGRIPVDGNVLDGHSFVDERLITGDPLSITVEKTTGSRVLAGTTNQCGAIEIGTVAVGRETVFWSMIEALAQVEKKGGASLQERVAEAAAYLAYAVLGSAAITLMVTGNLPAAISVLVVAGAHGITAGVPLAHCGAIARAAVSARPGESFGSSYDAVIMANLAGTITVAVAGVTLSAAGRIPPEAAAFIRVGSEVLFLLNSARLLQRPAYGFLPEEIS